jgi:hypothetical protein
METLSSSILLKLYILRPSLSLPAATLLSVAVVTALSTVEDADARDKKSKSSTSKSQSIYQKNTGSGNSKNFNSATNSHGSKSTTCINGKCITTTR